MTDIRILGPDDMPALEAFCRDRPNTTLFLRGNAHVAGLEDRGQRLQGTYAAAFRAGELRALAAHFWNGRVVMEAPESLVELVQVAARASGREVEGILGPWEQAVEARAALGLGDRPAITDSREELFALDLVELAIPEELAEGRVVLRTPRADELPLLAEWSTAFVVESLGEEDGPELRAERRVAVGHAQEEGRHWVLVAEGRVVATTAFNVVLPDVVQIGGVFTPPELRGRGHARCAVAGSLLAARDRGVERSVLFTAVDNRSAQAAYEAIGFRRVGDYAIMSFAP